MIPADLRPVHSVIDLWLGEQLRQRRKDLGLSLQQVAEACKISVSLLSQIERGLRSISMRTLGVVASHLDMPVDALVRNVQVGLEGPQGRVMRAGTHPCVNLGNKGICKENLTPAVGTGAVQLYRAVVEPGGATGEELFSTAPNEQVGYIVSGQLELFIDDQLLLLQAGDSFCYQGTTPRRWRNPGPSPTTLVWGIAYKSE